MSVEHHETRTERTARDADPAVRGASAVRDADAVRGAVLEPSDRDILPAGRDGARPDREVARTDRAADRAIERRDVPPAAPARVPERVKVAPPSDPEVLRREIRQTRDDLADALSSLAEKTHMKARVGTQLSDAKARVTGEVRARKTAIGVGAAGLAALLAMGAATVVVVRRRREGTAPVGRQRERAAPVRRQRERAAPVDRLRARAHEATAMAYEAQARLREAEARAVMAAQQRARRARSKARASRKASDTASRSRWEELRHWIEAHR